jgi:hypothetical protein
MQARSQESGPVTDSAELGNLPGCLNAIVARHGGRPTLVDYAHYEGRPAVIVVLTGPDGTRVVAAGPNCGATGPDELDSTSR